jgi:serine/threonine-protein kinase
VGSQAKLLFVDDEERVLTSMRAMFRRDYQVFVANSGAEAIELLRTQDVDVIVSDQRMPEMTGVEVLRQARELSPNAVRILLTGYADLTAIENAINECEVFRYLMKPCPREQLRETIALAVDAVRGGGLLETEASSGPVAMAAESGPAPADTERVDSEAVRAGAESSASPPCADSPEPAPASTDAASVLSTPVDAAPADIPSAASASGDRVASDRGALDRGALDRAAAQVADVQELLVLSDEDELVAAVRDSVPAGVAVRQARTLAEAVDLLSVHRAGVLVTDADVDGQGVESLTAELKRWVPELVTIVVSERADAQVMIDLINHGRVFRFLLKPVSIGQCRLWLASAFRRHAALCEHLGPARTELAPAGPSLSEPVDASGNPSSQLLHTLQELGARLRRVFGLPG